MSSSNLKATDARQSTSGSSRSKASGANPTSHIGSNRSAPFDQSLLQPVVRSKRTPIACTECRRRQVKCSGTSPRCERCEKKGVKCEYIPCNLQRSSSMGPVSAQPPRFSPTLPTRTSSRTGHSVHSAPLPWQDSTRNQHGYFPDPTHASRDAWQGQTSVSTTFSPDQHYPHQSMQSMAMYGDMGYNQMFEAGSPYGQSVPTHVGSSQHHFGQGAPAGDMRYNYASGSSYQAGQQMSLPADQR
ncbi:hypothetical protein OBBRIDRAFT_440506 [Obba rivulosa]|uniref:Zn(2)-C6 fungal-type domain-containing protein n=1 Tax=Obba rivulosa TaxID=1052685 RepID=A0A8E2DU13_9APHY|nr:hypothetical protein OBBRIDRAFT_440506 [Obba rivulosa]